MFSQEEIESPEQEEAESSEMQESEDESQEQHIDEDSFEAQCDSMVANCDMKQLAYLRQCCDRRRAELQTSGEFSDGDMPQD